MKRAGIVHGDLDPGAAHALRHDVPLRYAYRKEVVYARRPPARLEQLHMTSEDPAITSRVPASRGVRLLEPAELDIEGGGLDTVEALVDAKDHVLGLSPRAEVAQLPRRGSDV